MAWYSILPDDLIHVESWAVRIFFILGLVTILPWAALILFDAGLYLWRMVAYEFPVVGGRARGMQPPRAPGLNERPGGQRRVFSFPRYEDTASSGDAKAGDNAGDGDDIKRRIPRHQTE
ncbi:hypothetical protein FE257_008033 [Aspergillus nanangensis]|uniref:Uncharacterized protein n=1 Tax=Aspergillus nanangensis TaxID=2582783 RepID=A0AAD4CM77_ASPNN|nr:hypothetical protein FE257_008033 [Aspergillus nanangensis]